MIWSVRRTRGTSHDKEVASNTIRLSPSPSGMPNKEPSGDGSSTPQDDPPPPRFPSPDLCPVDSSRRRTPWKGRIIRSRELLKLELVDRERERREQLRATQSSSDPVATKDDVKPML